MKEYNCKICGWGPDEQKSHYDSHLKSKKHIDKVVIQKLKNAIKSGDKNIIEQIKNEPITDYKSMNQEQLLQLCKDKDIPYLTQNKKPYAKNNLIKRLQNCDSNGGKYVPDEKKSKKVKKKENKKVVKKEKQPKKKKSTKKKELVISDESYLRLPEYKTIYEFDNNMIEQQKSHKENRNYILGIVDRLHQILYDYEQLEGVNAMNDVMSLIFLKLIQDKISDKEEEGKIDLKNESKYRNRIVRKHTKLLDLHLLANDSENLRTTKTNAEDNIRNLGLVLIGHPITCEIFDNKNFLHAEQSTTIQKMLKEVILDLDVEKISNTADAIGEIYEHFVTKYTGTNSKLSQYFTPRKMMFLILTFDKEYFIKKIKEAKEKGELFSVYDPCMGTAGWLVIFLHMFQKYKDNLTFGGNEISKSTYMYALMNLVNALNKMPNSVSRCNSLTSVDTEEKYDAILQNPPFKTDVKFDIIKKNYRDNPENVLSEFGKIYHLKSNNPPIQFLELSIYKLKEGGTCTIVLPYGSLFFSRSFKKAREYLLKTINIKRIVLAPSGVFTHTGVKTCIITFVKEKGTKEIKFMKTNKKCNKLETITTVSIEDIYKEPDMSLYHRDYLKDEFIENLMNTTKFEYNKFQNIFELCKGKISSTDADKISINDNKYKFITKGSKKSWKNIPKEKCTLSGENIFIFSTCNTTKIGLSYYNGLCTNSNIVSHLKLNEKYKNKLNIKFCYYYLLSMKEYLEKEYHKGACHQSIDIKNINRMLFPILSLNIQNELVKRMELSDIEIEQLQKLKNINLEKKKFFLNLAIKTEVNKKNVINDYLINYCNYENGKSLTIKEFENGPYPVIGGGRKPAGFHNDYNMPENSILCSKSGEAGYISRYNKKVWASDCFRIFSKNTNILDDNYLYYYLKLVENSIKGYQKGITIMHMDNTTLGTKIKIVIPQIEVQRNILKGIQKFENLNKMYEKNIKETQEEVTNKFLEYFKNY